MPLVIVCLLVYPARDEGRRLGAPIRFVVLAVLFLDLRVRLVSLPRPQQLRGAFLHHFPVLMPELSEPEQQQGEEAHTQDDGRNDVKHAEHLIFLKAKGLTGEGPEGRNPDVWLVVADHGEGGNDDEVEDVPDCVLSE